MLKYVLGVVYKYLAYVHFKFMKKILLSCYYSYLWNHNICYKEILCILGIVDTVVTKEGRKMWNHVRECAQVAFLLNWVLYKYMYVCFTYSYLGQRISAICVRWTMLELCLFYRIMFQQESLEIRFMLHQKS